MDIKWQWLNHDRGCILIISTKFSIFWAGPPHRALAPSLLSPPFSQSISHHSTGEKYKYQIPCSWKYELPLKSDFQKCSSHFVVGFISRGLDGTSSKQLGNLNFVKPLRRKVSTTIFYLPWRVLSWNRVFETFLLNDSTKLSFLNFFELVPPRPLDRHPTS